MKKKLVILSGVVLMVATSQAYAGNGHNHGEHKGSMMEHKGSMDSKNDGEDKASQKELIEVGNKICPVSGEKVGQMGDPVKAEYNGKVYTLCCAMCKKDFMKNPQKYSAIAESEVAGEEAASEEDIQEHDHTGHNH